jgi:hypothetical protein
LAKLTKIHLQLVPTVFGGWFNENNYYVQVTVKC